MSKCYTSNINPDAFLVDSGINWIGKIPQNWEIKRFKDLFIECKNVSTTGSEDLLSVSEYYGVARRRDKMTDDEEFESRADSLVGYKLCRKNDLVINIMLAWKTGLGFSDYDGIVSPAYAVYRGKKIVPRYYHYLLRSDMYVAEFKRNSRGIIESRLRLYSDKFLGIFGLYPPLDEQQKIADYLDSKTSAIDDRIKLLQKKSEAYNRLKKSVINDAVTKGLNPNVKMKDSGVEWIGMIPEHWDVKRIKDVAYLYSGLTGKSGDDFICEDEEKTKPYIPFTNVLNNFYIDFGKYKKVVMSDNENQNRVREHDLIFLMSSEDYESIAKCAAVVGNPGEVYLNSFCRGLHFTTKNICASFVNYQLNSEKYRDALRFEARGFTRINIKIDRIASQFITIPSFNEQIAIANYIDEKCSQIDSNIENIGRQIEALKRLKKALINEVVTGQRTV